MDGLINGETDRGVNERGAIEVYFRPPLLPCLHRCYLYLLSISIVVSTLPWRASMTCLVRDTSRAKSAKAAYPDLRLVYGYSNNVQALEN